MKAWTKVDEALLMEIYPLSRVFKNLQLGLDSSTLAPGAYTLEELHSKYNKRARALGANEHTEGSITRYYSSHKERLTEKWREDGKLANSFLSTSCGRPLAALTYRKKKTPRSANCMWQPFSDALLMTMYPAIVKVISTHKKKLGSRSSHKFLNVVSRRLNYQMGKLGFPTHYTALRVYLRFKSHEERLVSKWGKNGVRASEYLSNTKSIINVKKNLGSSFERQDSNAKKFNFLEMFSRPPGKNTSPGTSTA